MRGMADRPVSNSRRARGVTSELAGRMAEDCVRRDYLGQGYAFIQSRWRGRSGEIDLIFSRDDEFVFVEVKKSSHHARAAERIDHRQIDRIGKTALEFCAGLASGMLTLMRFDAALVDQGGRVEIIENAFSMG